MSEEFDNAFGKCYKQVDSYTPVDAIFLQFSNTLNTTPNERSTWKVKSMKIKDSILAWIQDWLSERKTKNDSER